MFRPYMFRPSDDDNIFIKSFDDSPPDTTSAKENLILKHTLEIANLTALKFELEIVLGRFNKRSPGSVDLIFPNVQIKEKKMKPYIIYMIPENNFKALDKHQALDDGTYLIKKNDGGYQLWGCKEENTWRLTDIGIKDLAYLNIKDLEPSETQFNYKFLFVNPNTPLFDALKKALMNILKTGIARGVILLVKVSCRRAFSWHSAPAFAGVTFLLRHLERSRAHSICLKYACSFRTGN